MERKNKIFDMVMTALIMGLVVLATSTFRIPVPMTQGYVHLGDTMIFLGVLVLGRRNGCIAAGIGSALADVLAGYAIYAPWTLLIKGLMAFVMATFIAKAKGPFRTVIGMVLAGLVMVAGYCIVDGVLAGNMAAGMIGVPANIGQFAVGMVLANVLAAALCKTPAKRWFAYRPDEVK